MDTSLTLSHSPLSRDQISPADHQRVQHSPLSEWLSPRGPSDSDIQRVRQGQAIRDLSITDEPDKIIDLSDRQTILYNFQKLPNIIIVYNPGPL